MDLSVDKNVIFVAGASYKDKSGRSEGTIAALSFEKSLKVYKELVLKEEQIQACTAMQRATDRDDLAVGCYKHLLIIRYLDKKFRLLRKIKYVHSSMNLMFFIN